MSNDDLRTRLVELDAAIEKQQALLDTLHIDRENSKDIRRQLASIIYPVFTLPLDVTLEIFVYCNSFHSTSTYWSPTILLGICRTWRALAFSTPTLW
ncbi:hypothetical protein DFH07DRAFT_735084, partial [Mycena maculata]